MNAVPKNEKAGDESPALEAWLSTPTTIHELLGVDQEKLSTL
jgi:hypothetical protein